jgi:ubiquinone/menaquinone biosynthesis C-methylase UbiE
MFKKSARFYDYLYAFKDYTAASEQILQLLKSRSPNAQTLLDVACGTGRHLESFAMHFEVEGLDVNGDLLAFAHQRLPTIPLHQADMTSFELPRRFDVITCLFSSIGYVKSLSKMRIAVQRMAHHLNPDGVMIIEPWFTPDRYWTDTITANFVNEYQLKLAWMYTSKRVENVSVLEIHYMVGTPDGVEEFTETHEIGLFTHEEYLEAMTEAGLRGEFYSETTFGRGLYIGQWR